MKVLRAKSRTNWEECKNSLQRRGHGTLSILLQQGINSAEFKIRLVKSTCFRLTYNDKHNKVVQKSGIESPRAVRQHGLESNVNALCTKTVPVIGKKENYVHLLSWCSELLNVSVHD